MSRFRGVDSSFAFCMTISARPIYYHTLYPL